MKTIFTLITLALISIQVNGQRYQNKIFSNVTMDSVVYGNANGWYGDAQDLKMNIFEPEGDTASQRPLLVLAHGGSFIGGSRYALDVTYLCTEFAKRGYVCVSIQYRLGIDFTKFFTEGGTQFANAVWRGTLDGRAAIRYLKANSSTYKIDSLQIYLGGVSAGGVLGLHQAFLDLSSEVANTNPAIDTVSIGGGIEGLSGTPNNSWRVKGIINLCGALGNVTWMNNNRDIAIFSVHGTNDETVPYKTDYFRAFGTPIAQLSGSFVVDSMAKKLGMKSFLYTFYGAPHVPFSPGTGSMVNSTAYMDTTENLITTFLAEDLPRKVGLKTVLKNKDILLYPNPIQKTFTIEIGNGKENTIEIYDMAGKKIQTIFTTQLITTINLPNLDSGLYSIKISNEYGSIIKKVIVNN